MPNNGSAHRQSNVWTQHKSRQVEEIENEETTTRLCVFERCTCYGRGALFSFYLRRSLHEEVLTPRKNNKYGNIHKSVI